MLRGSRVCNRRGQQLCRLQYVCSRAGGRIEAAQVVICSDCHHSVSIKWEILDSRIYADRLNYALACTFMAISRFISLVRTALLASGEAVSRKSSSLVAAR